MKNHFWKSLIGMILLAVVGLFTTQCQTEVAGINNNELADEITDFRYEAAATATQQSQCSCLFDNYPLETLSAEEINALMLMREEEKMARDVYLQMYQLWDHRVFNNIAKSEQKHMDALACLFEKYDLNDPVGENGPGVFVNQELQSLYNSLTEQGSESLEGAFLAGAAIEDVDIRDLIDLTEAMDNEDIIAVFNELTKGSRNHLRAFNRQLSLVEASYTAQFITPELFTEIVSSPRERGGSLCFTQNNSGNGNGGICPNGGNGNGGNGNGGICPNSGDGNGGNGNSGICPNGGDGNGGNGNGGNGNGGNGNGGNGNGGNGNGGNGNGGNGNGGNGNG